MYKESSSSQSSTPRNRKLVETVQIHQPSKLPVPLPRKTLFTETQVVSIDGTTVDDEPKNDKRSKEQKNRSEKRRKSRNLSSDNSIASSSIGDKGLDRESYVSSSNVSRDNCFADSRNDTIVSNGTFDGPVNAKTTNEKKLKTKSSSHHSQSSEGSLLETRKKSRRKSRAKHHRSTTERSSDESQEEIETDRETRRDRTKKSHNRRRQKSSARDSPKPYTYEKLIGIFLHNTSELKVHELLKNPRIRVSVCNIETKKYWSKSELGRNIVADREPDIVDYIQPVISRAGRFKNSSSLIVDWEELIILNDDIEHLHDQNVIIFFELIEVVPIESKLFKKSVTNDGGWFNIAWAFLKVFPENKYSNFEKRLKLQFYKYNRKITNPLPPNRTDISIFHQYFLETKKKYPAILEVTVKGIFPIENDAKLKQPVMRSQNALQHERLADFRFPSPPPSECDGKQKISNFFVESHNLIAMKNQWRKLPGQAFKCPTKRMDKLMEHKIGSSIARFDKRGSLLAYTATGDNKINHIVVLKFPELQKIFTLNGHANLVYDLDWMESTTNVDQNYRFIVSASSDKTAIIWAIYEQQYHYKILPHPSFVYASRFFNITSSGGVTYSYVVTGGRDGIIRFWKFNENYFVDRERSFDLSGEVKFEGDGYIMSIVCQEKNDRIYSATSSGELLEVTVKVKQNRLNMIVTRTIKFDSPITSMVLHPRGRKIFANTNFTNRNLIKVIDIESLNTIKTFPEMISNHPQKFVISPCGTFIFTTTQAGEILSFNLITGKQENVLKPMFHFGTKNFISSVDFHPKDSYLCATVYGPNGGLALYEHEFIETHDDFKIYERPVFDRNDGIHQSTTVGLYNKHVLSDIIQKIDNVFLNVVPFENKNIDALPERKRYDVLTANDDTDFIEDEVLNQSAGGDDGEMHRSYRNSSASDNGNRTFSIGRQSTNDEESSGINTRTFSVKSGQSKSSKNRTYEIKPGDGDGSSTSVSEILE